MKHFNFLSNLLSLSLGSPCTDVSLDRRLTVGSPSGRYCSGLMRLVFILAILLTVGVGNVWGYTYTQLTSIANIDQYAVYVLGVEGSGSGKGFHYSGTSSWGLTAGPTTQTPLYYTLVPNNKNTNFNASTTISNTTYYLQVPTSNTFSMNTSSTAANTTLIIGTTQVSGTNYAVANSGTTARHLRINGTSGLRSYAGTTGSMAFFYVVRCANPTSLTNGTIASSTAHLSWTDNTNTNCSYEIYCSTSSSTPASNATPTATVSTKYVDLTGLESSTTYNWWVRAKDNTNSAIKSVWVKGSNFTTTSASYTVVWTINPAAGGTLSTTSGTSTTVTPNSAYTYGSPAYTVTTGSATVSQSTNTFTATPSANCTIRINMVEKPKYTVTYNAGTGTCGTPSWTQPSYGASTTLPTATAPATCTGWSFAGWCTSSAGSSDDNTSSPGTILEAGDSYTPTGNITLYAVYTKTVSGGSTTAHLTETEMRTNLNSSATGYSDASETSYDDTSDGIVWSGHFNANAGGYWVQLRQNATPAYLKIAASDNISQVKVTVTSASNKSGGQYDMEDGYNAFGSSINLYLSTANVVGDANANVVATAATNTSDTYQTLTLTPSPATNDELYILSSGACRVWLVDVTYSSSTTYYMTSLVCCTPLGSINGSFF